ncbi:FAD-binding monooxygenase ktnD [Penicillium hetheringtonii]|uniref:FAD-binding monooxygenase ktnD n=1 Tax=Penicillium hetheringtonii TaxID=911720 RepID=A0AAD6D9J0_9EURO|nr:FAD-binding monooxygenase ktnD [Penicillium hetheringtonii]
MPSSTSTSLSVGNKDYTNATVVIIGAGISGMCMAIDLIKRNKCYNFVILEKSSSVGGTWHDNKYPGCCCDAIHLNKIRDGAGNIQGKKRSWNISSVLPKKYGLYKHIRFNSTVEEARWDDNESKWKVSVNVSGQKDSEFANSYTLNSDFLISAVGQLNVPREPEIPGLQDFEGKMMHSARWDWSYDLKGKRIAVIGNGATAAQIIPEIAQEASHLTVFQRTPNWVIPRADAPVSALQKALLTYIPPLRWRKRALQMDFRESFHDAIFDGDSDFAQLIRDMCTGMMKAQLPDQPDLWKTLTPNYSPGCKRVIITDDYYPTLARKNVDLETRRIAKITGNGIEIEGAGVKEYDLIVLATGFKTVDFMYPIQVYGTNGRSLGDIWKQGAKAYYGMTVEDLPNFGMFYGPNTNLGHNSIILMIEAQSRYLNAMVGRVIRARQNGLTLSLKPKPAVLNEYNNRIQKLLRESSFADPNCNSWYKQDDGNITNNWSGTVLDYQQNLSQLRWDDYAVAGSGKDAVLKSKPSHLGRVREETFFSNSSLLIGTASFVVAVGGYFLAWPRLMKSR